MIETNHIPERIAFFDVGHLQLMPLEDNLTLNDLMPELQTYLACGFRLFSMTDKEAPFDFGFLLYPNEKYADECMEAGNLIMSQISSQMEDSFITPPVGIPTGRALEILQQQSSLQARRVSLVLEGQAQRLYFFTFENEGQRSGNA